MTVKKVVLKFALISTLIILLLAIYPLNMWLVKGSAWKGSYVVSNYDEVAYRLM